MQKVLLRYFLYTVVVAVGVAVLLAVGLRSPGGLKFSLAVANSQLHTSEFSPVEILQNILLMASGGCFLWVAVHDRLRRPMALVVAAFMLVCLIRELDFFFDYYVIDNLWQVLAGVVISCALVYGIRQRERFRQGWRRSWPSAGLAIMMAGFMLLLTYAQLVGHEAIWQGILGDRYIRVVKVAAEEFVELGAYLLIAVGTVEFVYAWSRLPRKRHRQK